MKTNKKIDFNVSDAILPLLDLTLLLLGLFMILFTVSSSQKEAQQDSENEQSASIGSLTGQVCIVKILDNSNIKLISSSGELLLKESQFADAVKKIMNVNKNLIFLLQIENPWDRKCSEIYRKCLLALKKEGASYARVFP